MTEVSDLKTIQERLRFFKARAERLKDERDQLRSDVAYQGSTILMLTNEKAVLERRIDELCQENEQLRQQNAKQRELVSDYSDCLDTALWLASDAGYPVMPARDKFLSLEKRKREMGIEVD